MYTCSHVHVHVLTFIHVNNVGIALLTIITIYNSIVYLWFVWLILLLCIIILCIPLTCYNMPNAMYLVYTCTVVMYMY